jgi:hypothetical protein
VDAPAGVVHDPDVKAVGVVVLENVMGEVAKGGGGVKFTVALGTKLLVPSFTVAVIV